MLNPFFKHVDRPKHTIKLGNFELALKQKLGEGAFGVVHKVTDEKTSTDYALKDVFCVNSIELSDAVRELNTLNLISHNNVIAVTGAFRFSESDGMHMMILTEFCAGGNLNNRLTRPSSDFTNFKWMREIAAALSYLHSCGVVHRDLKPENVLLTATEDIKLADFGQARQYITLKTNRLLDDRSWLGSYTQYHMQSEVGTPYWMAPEVFNNRYTEKADVFSLGLLYFAILQRDFVVAGSKKYYGAFVNQPRFHTKVGLGYAMTRFTMMRVAFSTGARGSNMMRKITLAALQYDEDRRPSAADVDEELETTAKEIHFWMKEASNSFCPISR